MVATILLYASTYFSNPTSNIYPKKMKSVAQRDIHTPMFIATLFIITKIWKRLSVPQWTNA